jgi:hypothetical protein
MWYPAPKMMGGRRPKKKTDGSNGVRRLDGKQRAEITPTATAQLDSGMNVAILGALCFNVWETMNTMASCNAKSDRPRVRFR